LILAIDIGNTNSKMGWFDDEGVAKLDRVETQGLVAHLGSCSLDAVDRIGIASVVPGVCSQVLRLIGHRDPFLVSHQMRLPFQMAYRTPETLGNDRLAASIGAWYDHRCQDRPVIAIDAGTAVTMELISADATYLGGTIAPGPTLLDQALQTGTAQLPPVETSLPESAVGKSTSEAIRAGIMYGFVDSVAGMLSRLTRETEGQPVVVATGAWAVLLASQIPEIDVVDPTLVLKGVVRSMRLNPA